MVEYFSHDFKARHDPKLINVRMKHKSAGIGIYWDLVEMLHENGGFIMLSECDRIAFELKEDIELIKSVIFDFDLFKIEKKSFYSVSALRRIQERKEKSLKAKASASIRWNNANALQTQSEGNAIKEKKSKVKESKEEKEIIKEKNWKTDFEIYKKELQTEFEKLISDTSYIFERENYHPGLDIIKSLEKAFNDFWNTEAGWKNKKQSRIKEIDWRATFNNALSLKFNQVWKKNEQKKSSAGSRAMETMMKYKALADQEEKQNLLKNE